MYNDSVPREHSVRLDLLAGCISDLSQSPPELGTMVSFGVRDGLVTNRAQKLFQQNICFNPSKFYPAAARGQFGVLGAMMTSA